MKYHVVIDSCFIIAVIDEGDLFHNDVIFIFNKLLKKSTDVTILVPPIVFYEVITNLVRRGLSHRRVEGVIMRLLHIEKIVALSIAETSAFKHAKKFLKPASQMQAVRTNDFLISCIAFDFDALILTFDRKAYSKIKQIYSKIYYCSSEGGYVDETSDFLNAIGQIK